MISNDITVIIVSSILLFLFVILLAYIEDHEELTTYSGNEIYIV